MGVKSLINKSLKLEPGTNSIIAMKLSEWRKRLRETCLHWGRKRRF